MAHHKVSHALLALALLASTKAIPMVPFAPGMLGMYGGLFGGLKPIMGGLQVGQSYNCGASYGSCARGREEVTMRWVYEPRMLSGVTRTVDQATGKIEGLLAIVEDAAAASQNQHKNMAEGYGGLGMGLGGYGMGHGLMGALGALGMYGQQEAGRLDLRLTVQVRPLPKPLDVVLVLTSAADQDICTAESLGPVLTGPSAHNVGYGYGASLLMQPDAFGGYGAGGGIEREFGVITQLTIHGGTNSFTIKGLGDFTDLTTLAGRGIALCEDVVMAVGGKPMCAGVSFGVLFCAKLGYTVEAPPLISPAASGAKSSTY